MDNNLADRSGEVGETKMSGRIVTRVKDTIFIPLPRALWREIEGGCACPYCSDNGHSQSPAYWDTLAVAKNAPPLGHLDYTYTVHYPQLNGARLKEQKPAHRLKSVVGGWQTERVSDGALIGPVFNKATDCWTWQGENL